MRIFHSNGMGINSVAMHLWSIEQGIEFESVFANHGSDHPSTYCYMEYFNKELKARGMQQVTVIDGVHKEKSMDHALNLYDYCLEKKIVPSMMFRWCTEKFKIRPVHDYINSLLEECEQVELWLGIASDESHRANPPQNPPTWMRNKVFKYPFVEHGITRQENIEIIERNGFAIPPKSGCYYCPYQRASELKKLYKENPSLYEKAKLLEEGVNKKRIADFKDPLYIKKYPLSSIVQEGQFEFDFSEYEELEKHIPCMCDL